MMKRSMCDNTLQRVRFVAERPKGKYPQKVASEPFLK